MGNKEIGNELPSEVIEEMLIELIIKSAQKLSEAEEKLSETNNPVWVSVLGRESTLLLMQAISLWIRLKIKVYKIRWSKKTVSGEAKKKEET